MPCLIFFSRHVNNQYVCKKVKYKFQTTALSLVKIQIWIDFYTLTRRKSILFKQGTSLEANKYAILADSTKYRSNMAQSQINFQFCPL